MPEPKRYTFVSKQMLLDWAASQRSPGLPVPNHNKARLLPGRPRLASCASAFCSTQRRQVNCETTHTKKNCQVQQLLSFVRQVQQENRQLCCPLEEENQHTSFICQWNFSWSRQLVHQSLPQSELPSVFKAKLWTWLLIDTGCSKHSNKRNL